MVFILFDKSVKAMNLQRDDFMFLHSVIYIHKFLNDKIKNHISVKRKNEIHNYDTTTSKILYIENARTNTGLENNKIL